MKSVLCVVLILAGSAMPQDSLIYSISEGSVHFRSDAPLEVIQAESSELRGLLDFNKHTFAFSVGISSFKGFNSALQREHFNENYMETERFPRATFAGKIIEEIDVTHPGQYNVRAKGTLAIHGVERERIIPATITVQNDRILIHSKFDVMLADHNIAIPKVVQHKIAESIIVQINCKATPK